MSEENEDVPWDLDEEEKELLGEVEIVDNIDEESEDDETIEDEDDADIPPVEYVEKKTTKKAVEKKSVKKEAPTKKEVVEKTTSKKVVEKKPTKKAISVLSEDEVGMLNRFQEENHDHENEPDSRDLKDYELLAKYQCKDLPPFKTNILSLDLVLGDFYKGKVVEISSPSGCGKSTLMMQLCKNIVIGKTEPHNPYGKIAYIDVEGGVNNASLEKLGLTKYSGKQFQLISNVFTFEKLEEVLKILLSKDVEPYDAIIIDSITDLIPQEMYEKNIDQLQIGLEARYTTSLIKKFKPLIRLNGTTLWLVNQMRVKGKKFGFQMKFEEDSAGPNIIAFAPDVRLKLSKGDAIKETANTANGEVEVKIGANAEIWSHKNRAENSEIKVLMPIIYGRGISDVLTMKNFLFKKEYLTIGGATHTLTLPNEEPIKFNGQKKFNMYLKENVYAIRDKLESAGLWRLINLGEVSMI